MTDDAGESQILAFLEADAMTMDELADATGASVPLLEALDRQGWLLAVDDDGTLFHPSSVDAIAAGLELVEAGLPLAELLALARRMDEILQPMASESVDTFARFVRDSVEAGSSDGAEVATRLIDVLDEMLPATGRLVGLHFQRLLIREARGRLLGDEG